MPSRSLLAATVAALLIAQPGYAQAPATPAAKPAKALQYLAPEDVDPARLLPAPARDGTPDAKAQLAEVHRIIAAASPDRKAQAKWDDDHEDASAFYATIGSGFDLKVLPATAEVLHVVETDGSLAASRAKTLFAWPHEPGEVGR